ncbi:MAG: hypothetical protein VKN33_05630 [Candidatus Sericytochromatia bacterium]|nr:hypothetical protein [Candidatus Sericytochromatia bacterium]
MRFTAATACVLTLPLFAGAAHGQALYRIEKEPSRALTGGPAISSDSGNANATLIDGFYSGSEEDFDLHAFAWRDGYSVSDGQPTFGLQVSLHRKPQAIRHIPQVISTRQRTPEWRIPVVAATYFVYPHYANPYVDKPLAILNGARAADGFRATTSSLPARNLIVRALVEHRGRDGGENYNFSRTYVFQPPTIAVTDGRHEPYGLYHWLW